MTYSVVARDPSTGELGVAVQSHWFSVGTIVSWGEAGVGVVATQSFAEPAYGPNALDLLRHGMRVEQVLQALTSVDAEAGRRQVAIVDTHGGVAAHTGERCIAHAGHVLGDQVSCQANMMAGDTVPHAMLAAFQEADDHPLAERLVTAIEAGQDAGGDVRGQQSAVLLVVAAQGSGRPWVDRLVDLRIDDHPQPVSELRRLLEFHRAYEHMNAGDERLTVGDVAGATREYEAARSYGVVEADFWHAVMLAGEGKLDDASAMLDALVSQHEGWRELLARLSDADILDADTVSALLDRLG